MANDIFTNDVFKGFSPRLMLDDINFKVTDDVLIESIQKVSLFLMINDIIFDLLRCIKISLILNTLVCLFIDDFL
jgi:hypothetical protein